MNLPPRAARGGLGRGPAPPLAGETAHGRAMYRRRNARVHL